MRYLFRATSSTYKHRISFRQALAFMVYDTDTVHLLTRHHKQIPPKGYLHPLSYSSWVLFLMPLAILIVVLQMANFTLVGRPNVTDITPMLSLFYYNDQSQLVKMISGLKLGTLILDAVAILIVFFQKKL